MTDNKKTQRNYLLVTFFSRNCKNFELHIQVLYPQKPGLEMRSLASAHFPVLVNVLLHPYTSSVTFAIYASEIAKSAISRFINNSRHQFNDNKTNSG
uniref:Uncharacterized protein n=1 Tax=Ascaris lumbricoides TaxID=6252 RepID=A0A0M3IWY2_ASCLU